MPHYHLPTPVVQTVPVDTPVEQTVPVGDFHMENITATVEAEVQVEVAEVQPQYIHPHRLQ